MHTLSIQFPFLPIINQPQTHIQRLYTNLSAKATAHFNSSDFDLYLFYKQTPVSPACLVYGHLSPQLSEKGLFATESELLLCVIPLA